MELNFIHFVKVHPLIHFMDTTNGICVFNFSHEPWLYITLIIIIILDICVFPMVQKFHTEKNKNADK
jgi:hypothetical protein